jgi:hypothetical protein
MLSESVIFPHCDFQVFRKAFKGGEPRASLFKTIEVDERVGRFTPYILDYFPNINRQKSSFTERMLFTGCNRTILSLTRLCLRM